MGKSDEINKLIEDIIKKIQNDGLEIHHKTVGALLLMDIAKSLAIIANSASNESEEINK